MWFKINNFILFNKDFIKKIIANATILHYKPLF